MRMARVRIHTKAVAAYAHLRCKKISICRYNNIFCIYIAVAGNGFCSVNCIPTEGEVQKVLV